jgi:hypothetical protein
MKTKITIFIIIAVCISCFLPTVSLSERTNEVKKERGWKELIKSDNGTERYSAVQMVLNERKDTVDFLLSIVNSPLKEGEEFCISNTPRNIAMSLLGTFRAKEAVQVLIQWLVPKPGQGESVTEQGLFCPAGEALVQIGLPSVLPLVDIIKMGDAVLREQCVKILVCIKGVSETEVLFESIISKEKDAGKKTNLQTALDYMKEPKMHKWLEDMYKRVNEQK